MGGLIRLEQAGRDITGRNVLHLGHWLGWQAAVQALHQRHCARIALKPWRSVFKRGDAPVDASDSRFSSLVFLVQSFNHYTVFRT